MKVDFDVLIIVIWLRGKWVVRAAVQKTIDKSDDEHLHDHHLLTEHCGAERYQVFSRVSPPARASNDA